MFPLGLVNSILHSFSWMGKTYFLMGQYWVELNSLYYVHCTKMKFPIKGQFRYEKMISQNVPSEAQVKIFFVWSGNDVPLSRYLSFCILNHPMFYQSVTSWCVLVHETWCIFEYLLNHNSLTHQTWWIDRCKQGQYLKSFE